MEFPQGIYFLKPLFIALDWNLNSQDEKIEFQ